MRKIFILIMCCALFSSCIHENNENSSLERTQKMQRNSVIPVFSKNTQPCHKMYKPINYDIQKAVWISYIDLCPSLTGKSESEFRYNFKKMCSNVSELGCNTIYLHLRPFGDAIYKSKLYPASRYITGEAEKYADFDPLEIMLEIAHSYDLSVHGWINPLRCENKDTILSYRKDYLIKKWYKEKSEKICEVDGDSHLWLNPAYQEVRRLIADGVKEIAEKYEIDGIHYDDYFYPTTDKSFDEQCFAQQDESDLSKWRMNNISLMVKEIYNSVKSVNPDILVGVSPQGNMENNYEYMYADVKKWCSENGYIDYIVPQIYFGYNNTVKPFEKTVEDWHKIITNSNVKLIAGLGVYKIAQNEYTEFSENNGIIARQINDSLNDFNCHGFALYNYVNLFEPSDEAAARTNAEINCIKEVLDN